MTRRALLTYLTAALTIWTVPSIAAQQPAPRHHRIVVALLSADEADWNLALGNIRNLLDGLRPDPTEIEVVAYGPGIVAIKSDSTVAETVAILQKLGVRFVACQNSMRSRHIELKDLLTGVTPVPSGIVEVVTRQEQGWTYIKGGR